METKTVQTVQTVRDILEKFRDKPFSVVVYSDSNDIHFDCRKLSEFDLDNIQKTSYNYEVMRMPVKSWFPDVRELRILV